MKCLSLFILLNPIAPAARDIIIQGTQNIGRDGRKRERRVRGGGRANRASLRVICVHGSRACTGHHRVKHHPIYFHS